MDGLFSWVYRGVDFSIPGTGGEVCRDYIPYQQAVLETIAVSILGLALIWYGLSYITAPGKLAHIGTQGTFHRFMLMLFAFVFGIEIGYKFASEQLIWILNPCHVVTIMQIYLLVSAPSQTSTFVFQVHTYCMTGPLLALVLPVINTRLYPFEVVIYYVQHVLLLVMPFFLVRQGYYKLERLSDFSVAFLTYGLLLLYHFLVLQPIGKYTLVNIDNMLCPAVSDPFAGPWYRMFTTVHQFTQVVVQGKLMNYALHKLHAYWHSDEYSQLNGTVHASTICNDTKPLDQQEHSGMRQQLEDGVPRQLDNPHVRLRSRDAGAPST